MTGYTRVFNKATSNVIEAGDFNTEYQSVGDAFSQTSGHKHDGTTAEGAYIPTLSGVSNNNSIEIDEGGNQLDFFIDVSSSKVKQIILIDGAILPVTDDDIDLGSASKEFKNLWIDGTANIDIVTAGAGTVGGSDIVTLSATQTLTNKTLTSPILIGVTLDDTVFTGSIEEEVGAMPALQFDPAFGTIQTKSISSTTTFTTALTDGESMTLHLTGGGGETVNYPSMTWMGGVAPTLGTVDVLEFWTLGSILFGAHVGTY